MMLRFLFAVLYFFSFLLSTPGHASPDGASTKAGPLDRLQSCAIALIEKQYLKLVVTNENETLFVHDRSRGGAFVGIQLDKQLGAGFYGAVSRVEFISDPEIEREILTYKGKPFRGRPIVKIPHSLKGVGMGRPFLFVRSANIEEKADYTSLMDALPRVESDPAYPKNPAWEPGFSPIVPILGSMDTERGVLLYKPELPGWRLSDIAKIYKEAGKKLPKEIRKGLHDFYQFMQAAHNQLPAPDRLLKVYGKGYAPDLRGPNLTWVTDPETLDFLHYKEPGIVGFEFSSVILNKPHYIDGHGLSFEAFVDGEYAYYLERELADNVGAP